MGQNAFVSGIDENMLKSDPFMVQSHNHEVTMGQNEFSEDARNDFVQNLFTQENYSSFPTSQPSSSNCQNQQYVSMLDTLIAQTEHGGKKLISSTHRGRKSSHVQSYTSSYRQ